LPIQKQKCIGKYVTSHAKTFFTVSVRTAECTASELGEQAPSEDEKESGGSGKKNPACRYMLGINTMKAV